MKKAMCALALLLAIALLPWTAGIGAASGEAEAERVDKTLTVPKGRDQEAFLLRDGYAATYMIFKNESVLHVTFGSPAKQLVTVWESEPEEVELRCYAGEELLLKTKPELPYLSSITELPDGTTEVELVMGKRGEVHLSEIYAYGEGTLPETEYQWQTPESPDVLLVVAYPGDEYRFFGGLLPKLVNDGANVAICYIADHSRQRLEEAFQALWTVGVRNYPVQLHVKSKLSLEYQHLSRSWKQGNAERLLTETLKELKPKVIVAPSPSEDGFPEQRLAGECTQNVCGKNTKLFKKLYFAEDSKNATVIADEPLALFGGETANAVAGSLFSMIHSADFMEYSVYESGAFRLAQSQPGSDSKKDSLFENLTVELHPPVTPTPVPTDTPEPTEEPTAEPTEAPTAEPTEEPAAQPTDTEAATAAPAEPQSTPETPVQTPAPNPKRGLFSCAGKEETPVPTAVPTPEPIDEPAEEVIVFLTPEPTEVPTPIPTPEPTEEPTPTPTPESTPEPKSEHYLDEGEEEQVVEDRENGYWSFRDQSTHIEIRRVNANDREGKVQVYFIAHVWMNRNMHRSGFGDEGRSGRTSQKAYRIARRYGAVLLITGDNIVNMDAEVKGALIRDGNVYNRGRKADLMAWNERELTFDLFEKGMSVEELLERGYRDVYSFGPILMQDGQLTPNLNKDRLGVNNPRTGVGVVEPGHFVLIVADGRQADYAIGLKLEEFAQLFKDEGCVSAYNLDGGVSAAMVFMGEHLNTHLNIKDRSKQRNLPDGLLFGHTFSLPDEMDPPPEHDGIRTDADDQLLITR